MDADDAMDIGDVWDAIKRASELPPSEAAVDALESLTRRATQLNEHVIAFVGHLHTINACNRVVLPERMLAAYTKMRAIFETHGHGWKSDLAMHMLRSGAFVIGFVDSFPEIPRTQLEALFAEQEELHRARGAELNKLLESRCWLEVDAGRLDAAQQYYDRLVAMPDTDDGKYWCPPCRINQRVAILARLGRDQDALAEAAPIVNGTSKCDTVPRTTWGTLLLPLARRGDWDTAREYHARAQRGALAAPQWLGTCAKAITFAAMDASFTKGKNVIERCLPHAFEPRAKDQIRDFHIGAFVFFTALARDRSAVTLTTPNTFPLHNATGRYEVAALRDWFETAARTLCTAFDRRNGNDYHVKRLATACDVLAIPRP